MFKFLSYILTFFEENNISYMLSGSVALSIYTIPRATRDLDFIVHIQNKDIDALINHFEKGFYCDRDAVQDAIKKRSLFNIIDFESGFKADFIVLKDEPYRITEFKRRQLHQFGNQDLYIVSPEDLLLSKLIWIQDYQSEIQILDIKALLELENLNKTYLQNWIKSLKLNTFNLLK